MSFFKLVKNSLGMELESPSYTVLNKIDDTSELRKYIKSKWVCTSMSGQAQEIYNNSDALSEKLINYISGQNADNVKINLTTPVTFDYIISNPEMIAAVIRFGGLVQIKLFWQNLKMHFKFIFI